MNIAPDLVTHRARGCPFIANVDGEDFVIDGFAKYGDECKTIYFAGTIMVLFYKKVVDGSLISFFFIKYMTKQTHKKRRLGKTRQMLFGT